MPRWAARSEAKHCKEIKCNGIINAICCRPTLNADVLLHDIISSIFSFLKKCNEYQNKYKKKKTYIDRDEREYRTQIMHHIHLAKEKKNEK